MYAFSRYEYDMSMIDGSDLFQLSASAEIHTFPCFSRVVVQAQGSA